MTGKLLEELSSDSDTSSDSSGSSDSDCVFLYATSGSRRRREICQEICRYIPRKEIMRLTHSSDLEMNNFVEEVLQTVSSYVSPSDVTFYKIKKNISSIGQEEDMMVSPCDPGERVFDQCL